MCGDIHGRTWEVLHAATRRRLSTGETGGKSTDSIGVHFNAAIDPLLSSGPGERGVRSLSGVHSRCVKKKTNLSGRSPSPKDTSPCDDWGDSFVDMINHPSPSGWKKRSRVFGQ